jgi:hypothetical protein
VVVFLVDDHQPEAANRGEDRRARPDDDVHEAAADPVPLVVALSIGEPTVLNRYASSEHVAEHLGDRGGQRDLRHEHERGPPGVQGLGREAEVQLGLPAAGHAVQQRDLEAARGHVRPQPLERVGLLGREEPTARSRGLTGTGLPDRRARASERIAFLPLGSYRQEPSTDEAPDGVRADPVLRQRPCRQSVGRAVQGR